VKEAAIQIVRRLREAGYTAYFAGGCVRDMLRGVEPKDFDVATSAKPEEIVKLFPRTVEVGAQFGVVLVIEGAHQFEVATFRSDEAYVDGRRPSGVIFSSPEQDARRRDFTINGMFFDPFEERVIDFVGGKEDLERKLVRAIGDAHARFTEDKLRLLRCVRIASALNFGIEPKTFEAVQAMASQITVVSAERIRDELNKMFVSPRAGEALRLLDRSGLLQHVLPEIAALKGVQQPPQFHPEGDVWTHVCLMMDAVGKLVEARMAETKSEIRNPKSEGNGKEEIQKGENVQRSTFNAQHSPNDVLRSTLHAPRSDLEDEEAVEAEEGREEQFFVELAWAVLLHDSGKAVTFEVTKEADGSERIRFNGHDAAGVEIGERVMRRLKFPNETIYRVLDCVDNHMRIKDAQAMRLGKLKNLLARPTFPVELELHRIDCESSNRFMDNYLFLKQKFEETPREEIKPPPLLTGRDLLEMGFPQGKILGAILNEARELQLEERLKSREEALAWARGKKQEERAGG
jgi:poly(A) polymerase